MTDSSNNELTKKLADLQAMFKDQLPGKLETLQNSWKQFLQSGQHSDFNEFYRLAHGLAGSSGTFGAIAVGNKARQIELLLKTLKTENSQVKQPSEDFKTQINDLLFELSQIANIWQPSEIPYIQPAEPKAARDQNLIYLTEDDVLLANNLIRELEKEKYLVRHFADVKDFEKACYEELPAAIIMDIIFEDSDIAGAETISRLNEKFPELPPVVFVSVRDDMHVRLAAARAGARRYFCKPIDERKLINTLDGLTARISTKPFRVLLVDDDEELSEYYQLVLSQSGIEAKCLSNPMDALEALKEFIPDIIVLDVYMPECSGPELAQVIRQDDAWVLTPIMFLSTETDMNRQLSAMSLGGDDFLVKPVSPNYLVTSVIARAKRARWAKRLNKEMLDTLRENEYQLVTMNQHGIVSVTDTDGNIISANDKFCEISGYTQNELIGKNHNIIKSGTQPDSFYKEMWDTISSGSIWHGEICNKNKSGELYWIQSTIVPFLDADGKPYKYVAANTDVTQRKIAEEELRESEEKYRLLYEKSEEPMWVIVGEEFVMANQAAVDILGYDSIESLKDTHPSVLSPEYQPDGKSSYDKANEMISMAFKNGYHRFEWAHKKKDGTVFPVDVSLTRVPYKGSEALFCVWRDITKNKEAEDQLRESEERFSLAVEGAEEGVWDWDMKTNEVQYSDIWMTMLGYEPNELPYTFNTFNQLIHPNDVSKVQQRLNDYLAGKSQNFSAEFQMKCKNGNYKWILSRARIIRQDAKGKAIRMTGIHSDINKQKFTEQNLILAREEAEKANHAKSEFLSSMSHELRTPMNAIIGFAQLLKMDFENSLSASQQENVDEIIRAGEHLLDLINEVLDLAKIESGQIEITKENVSVGDVISDSMHLINPLAKKRKIEILVYLNNENIEFKQLSSLNCYVKADRVRLKQVLLNLISNAIKYNKDGGKVYIKLGESTHDQLRINIVDTGIGLTEEQQTQLFTAFNRLGADQSGVEGTGIGLVITKNIVDAMNGKIGVYSAKGEGATFWIELPIVIPEAEPVVEDSINDIMNMDTLTNPKKDYTILYIEDNPANLRLVEQLLARRKNVELLSSHDVFLGLELAALHHPDIILLDLNLPGLNGYQVLHHLHKQEATLDTPVIAISANAMPKDVEKGLKAGFVDYITKPIDVTSLLVAIDKELSKAD